jgi:GxxExxY protein
MEGYRFDALSKDVVDCAFKIHQTIGTGLLENIYEDCFVIELEKRNIAFERQKIVKIVYEGIEIPSIYRLDLVISNQIIVELKSVENISRAHQAQILTYMKTSGISVGLIINFGEPYFKAAIKRFVI